MCIECEDREPNHRLIGRLEMELVNEIANADMIAEIVRVVAEMPGVVWVEMEEEVE